MHSVQVCHLSRSLLSLVGQKRLSGWERYNDKHALGASVCHSSLALAVSGPWLPHTLLEGWVPESSVVRRTEGGSTSLESEV